ncbi:MAG: alpha/beta hydrolase [Lachnospiraceae bacterium]|nr:alpha/beta hydrolase [Lachnospiraceae bacterium]
MKRKRKRMLIVIAAILGVLLVFFVAFAFWLPSFIMTGKRQTLEEAFDWQTDHYDTSFYENLEKTDYTVKGFEDYELHVQFLKNPNPTTKYVILSHGYTDNRMGSLKYVPMYLDLGFNCIIYDLRGHGENESTFTTYGVREGKDLKCLVDDTRERYPDITVLGLHGESLGAATTITSLKYMPEVDFVVADCGFSDIENVLKEGYRNAHLPTGLVDIANVTGKIRYHYAIKEMRPIDSLDENEIPVLFLHGENDTFILPKNSEDMAARTKGYKEIYIIPGAGHAQSVLTEPELYKEYVRQYLVTLEIDEQEIRN